MIRAIFLDVDGTLISFKTHEIPASARDALVRAHAQGIRLFIATGRAANDLAPLEGIPYDGVAALNGSCCVASDGRVVSRSLIPRADFERALRLSDELGFALALVLFAGIRERLDFEDVPKAFKGVPIALITAGILAMAFMGFSGLV